MASSQTGPATITIRKDAQPDHRRRFRFTGSLGNFQLSGDEASPASARTFTVNAGVYTVTERVPANWLLTDIVCTLAAKAAVDLSANQVVLSASSGDNIACTFINQKVAAIRAFLFHDSNGNDWSGVRMAFLPLSLRGWLHLIPYGRLSESVIALATMNSLYDELAEKVKREPRISKPTVARFDLTLLLFNAGDDLRELWLAAAAELAAARQEGRASPPRLEAAVEKLRPIFGERTR